MSLHQHIRKQGIYPKSTFNTLANSLFRIFVIAWSELIRILIPSSVKKVFQFSWSVEWENRSPEILLTRPCDATSDDKRLIKGKERSLVSRSPRYKSLTPSNDSYFFFGQN